MPTAQFMRRSRDALLGSHPVPALKRRAKVSAPLTRRNYAQTSVHQAASRVHAACAGTSFRPWGLCRMAAMLAGAWRPNLISHRSCQISQALWWACSLICPAARVAVPLKQGAFCVLPPHLLMLCALWYNPRRLVRRMVATRWFETARLPAKFSTKAPEDLCRL